MLPSVIEKLKLRCHFNYILFQMDNYKLDSETQQALLELLPFIKSRSEDIMCVGLVDIIKIMIYQFLPAKYFGNDNKNSKLDSLLTEALSKFQGRRYIFLLIILIYRDEKIPRNVTCLKDPPFKFKSCISYRVYRL